MARTAFAPALKAEKLNLASFAMSQPSPINEPYTNCGESVAGGAMVARTPAVAPAPLPSNLLTAQNEAAAAKAAPAAPAAADPADRPLGAGLRAAATANAAAPPAPAAPVVPPAASSAAAVATADAGGANSSGQAGNSNSGQGRSVTRPPQQSRYGSDAYRERLAQQREARQRAAAQRLSFRDRYDARGYYWPADPYWEYCYTRYGVRMTCAEAAAALPLQQLLLPRPL